MSDIDSVTPPYSSEAEQSVLGSLILNNNCIDQIGDLKSAHFHREDHRAIFTEIMRCITQGQPADVISVWVGLEARGGPFLDGLLNYLNSIVQNTPSAANVARYAEIVRDRAVLRDLLYVTGRAADLVRNTKGKTAEQVLDTVQSMVSSLAERRAKNEPKMISDHLIEFVEEAAKRSDGLDTAIPVGIESLDTIFNGGLRGGQLIILAGRPSMGKSALGANIGLNIAKTYSVLLFSMEMGSQECAGRALASIGRIPLSRVLGKIDGNDEESWASITYGCQQLQTMKFAIDDTPAITLLELRIKAKAWKRRHGLDVLIVDYLGLMSGGDGEKRHEQVGSNSRGLKALAKELDVAIIALAQLSRKSEDRSDRKPILSDLRDSGEIEQDADLVAFVHRPEMHEPNNSQLKGYAEVLIRKQRNGPLGDIPLQFNGATCSFSEWNGARPAAHTTLTRRNGATDL